MNASQILALPEGRPDKLFPSLTTIENVFKTLAKQWHPDTPDGDVAVFQHIQVLYRNAKKAAANGSWGFVNTLVITKDDGKEVLIPYIAVKHFSLGLVYICDHYIIFEVPHSHEDFTKQFLRMTKSYEFPKEKMRQEFERYLPQGVKQLRTKTSTFIKMDRKGDMIRLSDVLANGPIDPKQVSWIISSMYNNACWLNYAKTKHFDLSLDSYFISPAEHVGALLGGWFYAGDSRYDPIGSPAVTAAKIPSMRTMSSAEMHTAQIRLAARSLFGITSIPALKASTLPDPIKKWLYAPPEKDVVKAYAMWHTIVEKSWGPRKFSPWPLTSNDAYNN